MTRRERVSLELKAWALVLLQAIYTAGVIYWMCFVHPNPEVAPLHAKVVTAVGVLAGVALAGLVIRHLLRTYDRLGAFELRAHGVADGRAGDAARDRT